MPIIDLFRGEKLIGSYAINKKMLTIGRSRENVISIANKAISRFHARIELLDNGYILTDLNSLNGSFLNDARVQRALVSHNDHITVGPYTIHFKLKNDTTINSVPASGTGSQIPDSLLPEELNEAQIQCDDADAPEIATPVAEIKHSSTLLQSQQQPETDTKSQTAARTATVIIKPEEQKVSEQAQSETPTPPLQTETKNIQIHGDTNRLDFMFAHIPLFDKVKNIIGEKAFINEEDIIQRLATPDYGDEKISEKKLKNLLKDIHLDTPLKRYQFFKQF